MNLLKISWANLRDKPLSSFLSGLLMTLGIAIISLLLLLNKQLDEQFARNVRGIDMVLGAKGSPLQLILSSIYQIDAPVGNIPLDEAERLTRNPMIKTAIPLALGDNYRSFRIVGTNKKYVEHFGGTLASGTLFSQPMDVAVGSRVASVANLKLGDTLAGSHGLDEEGEEHADKKYRVVGIFQPSNTVLDQLILTPVASVWSIHEDHTENEGLKAAENLSRVDAPGAGPSGGTVAEEDHEHEAGEEHHDDAPREITSMLIKFRNPLGMMLARGINNNSKLQAALPSIEINRLFTLLGVGVDTLRGLALVIIIIAGISVFVSLYNSLKERRYEMALMLSMGATRTQLFGLLLLEGLVLAIIGFVLGVTLSRVGLLLLSARVETDYHYSLANLALLPAEWAVLAAAVGIGVLAAALPALGVYRMNISQTLADE